MEKENKQIDENNINNEEVSNKEDISKEEISSENIAEEKESTKVSDDPLYNKNQFVESFEYEDDCLKEIEDERTVFAKFVKKHNILKWIVALVGLCIIGFACIGLPTFFVDSEGNQLPFVMPTMIFTVVITLGGIITYVLLFKRFINKKVSHYFNTYYSNTSKYVFNDKNFSSFELQKPDKIAKIQFDENYLYKDVAEVGSRGLVDFTYKDRKCMVCDCAAQVKDSKRIYPIYVGKYLVGPAKYDGDERIVIYIKGDDRAIFPNNLEDLELVLENDNFNVYTNNKNWKKVVNATVIKKLNSFKTGSQLVDVAISIYGGHTYICLGYDDPIMVLPFEHAFDPSPIKEYKKELLLACNLIWVLSK